ncbi:MAG: hypothetical protein H7Y88_11200 [Phycisphaerales bacterium]|nr:hypothetical protein [Phycisphaerales bacterium]
MAVNRCVCLDLPFVELLELARREGLGFDELSRRTECCTGCGLCEPYVRVALRTGKTDLPVLSKAQIEAALSRPRDDERKS